MTSNSEHFTRRALLSAAAISGSLGSASAQGVLPSNSPQACGDMPSPRDWGANGRGNNDDTDAWQKAIDEVRHNPAYPHMGDGVLRSYVRAPAGIYVITRSLDFTTDGSLQGLGIRGDGQLQTVIHGELTEAYPVLDMTGMSGAQLHDFQIRTPAKSLAICNVLLAMDPNNHFHNRYPLLRNLLLQMDVSAPNGQAALVAAASDLAMLENVICDGPVGAIMGWRLPMRARSVLRNVPGSSSINLNTDGLKTLACTGYPIRITSGTGKGQIRTITTFDEHNQTATVSPPWSVAPGANSVFEISAVRSKFRLAQATYDQTNYWIRDCQFIGRKGFVFTGGIAINFDDVYFASAPVPAEERSIFLIADQDPAESPGPMFIHARGIRTENQTVEPECYAITTAQPGVSLDISGELAAIPLNGLAASGAVLHNVGSGSFSVVKIDGHSSIIPLFKYTGDILSLWSTYRTDTPGELSGSIGLAIVDWGNRSRDPLWNTFLARKANTALTPGNLRFGTIPTIKLKAANASLPAGLTVWIDPPQQEIPYRASSGIKTVFIAEIPENLLSADDRKPGLRAEFGGRLFGSGQLSLNLRQNERVNNLFKNVSVNASVPFALTMSLTGGKDRLDAAAGRLETGTSSMLFALDLSSGPNAVNLSQRFEVTLEVESDSDNPLRVLTRSFSLS